MIDLCRVSKKNLTVIVEMDARRRFFSSSEQVGSPLSDKFDSYKPRQRSSSIGSKIPQRKNMMGNHSSAAIHKGSNLNTWQTKTGRPLYVGSSPAMSDDKYDMSHSSKGRVVIFVHENFKEENPREGARADVDNLLACLPILGFRREDISIFYDYTLSEITDTLARLSAENYRDRDCLMIFVLTHGDRDDRIHAKDTDYTVEKIWKPFIGDRCIGLTGKPKIFFIVACRGSKTDTGVLVRRVRKLSTATDASPNVISQSFSIPLNADMLTIFSTVQGYYSYREPDRGTWFIEAFRKELDRLAETKTKINLTKFLECVNRRMCQGYETYNPDEGSIHEMKQCASYTSTLTRTAYLTLTPVTPIKE